MTSEIHHKSIVDLVPKATIKEVLLKFIFYFPLCFCFVFGLLVLITQFEYKRVNALTAKEQADNLHLVKFIIQHDLETLAADLLVLANSEALKKYHRVSSHLNRSALAKRFLLFVRDRKVYDQARYLDLDGNEVVRVNIGEKPRLVAESELQNKKDRYYFRDTLSLGKDKIFVSPLDLNIENGQIQEPFVPVVRVGTPVFDESGVIRGIVLLNFKAERVLNRYSDAFRDIGETDKEHFSIVNGDGFWLLSHEASKEWGFMFGSKLTLQREEPLLWQTIKEQEMGQLRLKTGLYSFETIYPAREIMFAAGADDATGQRNEVDEKQHDLAWHLILNIPDSNLSYFHFISGYAHLFWVLPLLLVFVIAGALFFSFVLVRKVNMANSLTLLSTALEQSPAAVVITDVEGKIVYANPKFETMTGYMRSEVLGKNPRVFKSGKTPDKVYSVMWKTVLGGHVWKGDFENRRKDGTSYYVSAQIAPMYGSAGEIRSLLAVQEDVTDKRLLQKELERLARIDGLTGILNRNYFMKLFLQEARRVIRYGHPLTVLTLDLDYFKNINDGYGHHAGDKMLKACAEIISQELRENDLFGRLGGEEFGVILVGTDGAGGFLLAERLRKAVEWMQVPVDGNTLSITLSIGGTEWKSEDVEIEEVLKRADRALYEAKHQGRNRVLFDSEVL